MKKLIAALLVLCYLQTVAALAQDSSQEIEKSLIKKHSDLFERKGKTFSINLEKGKKKNFVDNYKESSETFLKTSLIDYLSKNHVAVLDQRFYEGGRYLIVPLKTGGEIALPTQPSWSSDQSAFIATNDDESDYTENVVVIGVCKDKKCSVEYKKEARASEPKWLSSSRVQFEERIYKDGSLEIKTRKNIECDIKAEATKKPSARCSEKK